MGKRNGTDKDAAVVGAGLMGRMLAAELIHRGWRVVLFDPDGREGARSCGHVGAGMLAPFCELESADLLICDLGLRSLDLWPDILARLPARVGYSRRGSLVVAHPRDQAELDRLRMRIRSTVGEDPQVMRMLGGGDVRRLEPDLPGSFGGGLYFPREGHIHNRELMAALRQTLEGAGADWRDGVAADRIRPGEVAAHGKTHRFDWVFDCRGLGATDAFPALRGVRGELIHLHAPEVELRRPVRLMHPRYPLYIVPRRDRRFVVGATSIESNDPGPASVRSALELLTAAYSLHPGFAEARILEIAVQCRPALPDNLPRIRCGPGLVRINGLYRHGFLLAPSMVEYTLAYTATGRIPDDCGPIMEIEDGINDEDTN